MDQLLVDCGDAEVRVGEEVVLIGNQGDETIEADELGRLFGTIGYEIVSRIGERVPRRYAMSEHGRTIVVGAAVAAGAVAAGVAGRGALAPASPGRLRGGAVGARRRRTSDRSRRSTAPRSPCARRVPSGHRSWCSRTGSAST